MNIGVKDVKKAIYKLCDVVIENEVYFCELDSVAGDGDFGMSLAKGFKQVKSQLDEIQGASPSQLIRDCGMIITEYCGGASGPIWGSAFRAAANSIKEKDHINEKDISIMLEAAIEGIQKRGGAKLGDKTLLDALIPATKALKDAIDEKDSLQQAVNKAAFSAKQGAEHTKTIVASKGRASYLGERSLNYPDAGAVAMGVIFEAFATEQ